MASLRRHFDDISALFLVYNYILRIRYLIKFFFNAYNKKLE